MLLSFGDNIAYVGIGAGHISNLDAYSGSEVKSLSRVELTSVRREHVIKYSRRFKIKGYLTSGSTGRTLMKQSRLNLILTPNLPCRVQPS